MLGFSVFNILNLFLLIWLGVERYKEVFQAEWRSAVNENYWRFVDHKLF